ncbi:hypothetical protein U1Q18_051664, partial [Sarracenia purpurea var. burkii]
VESCRDRDHDNAYRRCAAGFDESADIRRSLCVQNVDVYYDLASARSTDQSTGIVHAER